MNGLRHGFAASRIVLATEERAQFDVLRESFIQIHDPGNDVETALVDQMVVAQWRLLRMWAGEAAILDRRIAKLFPDSAPAPEPTPFDQFGQAFETFANGESPLKLMSRYQTDCRWQYDRAFRSLNALRESQPDEIGRASCRERV